jgi:hypothetical protein
MPSGKIDGQASKKTDTKRQLTINGKLPLILTIRKILRKLYPLIQYGKLRMVKA